MADWRFSFPDPFARFFAHLFGKRSMTQKKTDWGEYLENFGRPFTIILDSTELSSGNRNLLIAKLGNRKKILSLRLILLNCYIVFNIYKKIKYFQ